MNTSDTFISHLIELRDRLLHIVAGIVLTFICLFPFANDIYSVLAHPLLQQLPQGGQMIATAVTTPFFVPMKVAMLSAFVISLPYTLYQVWAFIAPGLYQHEKRFAAGTAAGSTTARRWSCSAPCFSCSAWPSPIFWYFR